MKQAPTLLGSALIAASVLIAGWWLRDAEPPRLEVGAPEVAITAPPVAPQSLVSAQDQLFYADGQGNFFHLEPGPEGLRVVDVQRLVHDPLRHVDDPARRELHGFYLDDLASLERERRDAFRAALERTEDEEAAARLARELFALGDVEGLLPHLESGSYVRRRQAAFTLGEAGYLAAVPALIDLLSESEEGRRRAHAALVALTGEDYVENIERVDQSRAAEAWRDWFRAHPPATPFARGAP